MQFYSGRQFKRDGNTIPNLPTEYQLVAAVQGPSTDRVTWSLTKHGVTVLTFRTVSYDTGLSIIAINYALAEEDSPIINESMHCTTAARIYLDDLYYTYNPPVMRSKSGKVFSKTFLGLRQRLGEGREYCGTKLTLKAMRYVSEYIKARVQAEFPQVPVTSEEFNILCNKDLDLARDGYAAFHSFTGEFIARPRIVTGSLGKIYTKSGETPEQFGYRTESYRYNTYWLKEGEFLLDGTVVSLEHGAETCPDCGTFVPSSYMIEDPDDGHRTCKKCASQTFEIHSYSTRVPSLLKFKAHKVTPSTLYLGCELEYETSNRESARKKVGRALKGHAIMKSDGSIRDGFEVVTCPATLEIHLEVFKKFFENRPSELKIASNVGMHVHVSRGPLSLLTVGKMTEFMNRPDNVKFITHIAGRAPNNYCRQDEGRTLSFPLTSGRGERYNSLNLNNSETVEFRIFSTPLTFEDFAHKVEFCQALTEYSKPGVLSVDLKTQTSYAHFIKWALANHKAYPELAAKIKSFSA
jgi:hypothetical protein